MTPLFATVPVWVSAVAALHLAADAKAPSAEALDYLKEVPSVAERLKGPAAKRANLSPGQCRQLLKKADATGTFKRQGAQSGIASPVRFVGPLGDTTFRVPGTKFPFGVLDCRQALIWLDMLPLLKAHHITEIRIDNFYRQGARLPRKKGRKSQHAYGLAADVVSIRFDHDQNESTQPLLATVSDDFYGKRDQDPCGPKAELHLPPSATADDGLKALALRNFVCQLGREGWFHHILTPNYNAAHESHLHFDIKRDNKWFSLD